MQREENTPPQTNVRLKPLTKTQIETLANNIHNTDDYEYTVECLTHHLSGEQPSPQTNTHSAADIVNRIAEVSNATGFLAGEPAIELAGQIISVLAAHPEHIDRFMAEGPELFIDGTFNPENGSMTYRANSGAILHPSVLREKKGIQQ